MNWEVLHIIVVALSLFVLVASVLLGAAFYGDLSS